MIIFTRYKAEKGIITLRYGCTIAIYIHRGERMTFTSLFRCDCEMLPDRCLRPVLSFDFFSGRERELSRNMILFSCLNLKLSFEIWCDLGKYSEY